MELSKRLLDYGLKLGANYVAILYQVRDSASITVENGQLKGFEAGRTSGLGIRTVVDGVLGIASSTFAQSHVLKQKVKHSIRMAKSVRSCVEAHDLAEVKPSSASTQSCWKMAPEKVSDEEKIRIALEANKAASIDGIKNSVTHLDWLTERRVFMSSEGARIERLLRMVGFGQFVVANAEGKMEYVSDSKSRCAGFEFIMGNNWTQFSEDIAKTANKAVRAHSPRPGNYQIVADPDLIGLILHEALGHAAEGDLVRTKESVLEGRIGQRVGSPLVTIVDQGIVEGGYNLPYDDEGVDKGRCVVVEEGVLKSYLHSRSTAYKLHGSPTGNARVQGYGARPIVRQTNFFMEAGDSSLEELFEGVQEGLYICGKGARGGEVDVGQGTFTFRAGPSYIIRKGEVAEMVRGVSISGMVLEALSEVSAVGKDAQVRTSIFGGCGKDGQRVHVGTGGPHVRFERISVGGGV